MKTKLFYCALIGMLALLMSASFERASAQGPAPRAPGAVMGTAFTYQGQIKKSGSPVTSTCTFAFGMWDAASGGTQLGSNQTVSGVSVSNGLFTTQLNGSGQFGANAFTGDARWLAISVQCTGDGSATSLGRQQLTPAPFALALPGLYTQQTGDTPNIIGGYSGNSVTSGGVGATIGGGGGSGWTNRVTDNFGTVGGGYNNRAGDNAGLTDNRPWATVSGGVNNVASGTAATIGGGYGNTTSGAGAFVGGGGYDGTATSGNTASGEASTIGGGRGNVADGGYTFVGGGVNNTASGRWGAIGGGAINTASGSYATVPGGVQNTAAGYYSFAAGRRAKANHDGAFVWGDSTDADIASATTNQFVVRAANGAYVTSNFSGSAVYGYNNGGSGVKGETASIGAMGVYGLNNNTTSGYGVYGQGFRGVQGYTNSASGMGGFSWT